MKKQIQIKGAEIVRSLSQSNLIDINDHLDKTYAFTYALHELAIDGGLEGLGDEDAFIILDEAIVNLQEAKKLLNEGVKKTV